MTQSALTAIVAVAAVALLGMILRRASASPETGKAVPPPPEPDEEEVESEDHDEADGTVAITSDGWAFVPVRDRDRVRLVPPRVPEGPASPGAAVDQLGRGDLIAARVKRGAPDHDPWRLEGLGRDREYRAWRFETEEAARAAHELVERRVVRAPRDDESEPVTIVDADFDEARRREEEIEAELATLPEGVEPDPDSRREPIG